MSEVYPSRRGVPINPAELDFSDSQLDPDDPETIRNHHAAYESRKYGCSVLLSTFCNLATNQYGLPLDTHQELHLRYDPPVMPTIEQAYSLIRDERDQGGRVLRYGSYNKPVYKRIGARTMQKIDEDYNQYMYAKRARHNRTSPIYTSRPLSY